MGTGADVTRRQFLHAGIAGIATAVGTVTGCGPSQEKLKLVHDLHRVADHLSGELRLETRNVDFTGTPVVAHLLKQGKYCATVHYQENGQYFLFVEGKNRDGSKDVGETPLGIFDDPQSAAECMNEKFGQPADDIQASPD